MIDKSKEEIEEVVDESKCAIRLLKSDEEKHIVIGHLGKQLAQQEVDVLIRFHETVIKIAEKELEERKCH